MTKWTRDEMAARIARDIPDGSYVNLGIGLPTLVAGPNDEGVYGVVTRGFAPGEQVLAVLKDWMERIAA